MVDDKDEIDEEEFDEDEEEESLDEDEMPDIGGDTMIGDLDDDDDDDVIRSASKPDPDEAARKREVRRRLDEFAERRNQDLDDTFNFNFDDEI
ncbi:MAG: hypothetical protein P8X94_03660 [Woeseiaceae bacterium]